MNKRGPRAELWGTPDDVLQDEVLFDTINNLDSKYL